MDSHSSHAKSERSTDATTQFLTFTLQEEEYALDILKVQEIKGLTKITPIPNAPGYIRGVMNLRGTVVPVIDLRVRFNTLSSESQHLAVIIVVNVAQRIVGLMVDTVSDVLRFDHSEIEAAPDLGRSVDTTFIAGMAKTGDKLVMVLDIDKLLIGDELPGASEAA
ncbi:MAG: chemotaxis protein CheW [Planctomycetaceae bacterium]|nr:chemotaxis protein CheW [Planctomycetaceae bacterium]